MSAHMSKPEGRIEWVEYNYLSPSIITQISYVYQDLNFPKGARRRSYPIVFSKEANARLHSKFLGSRPKVDFAIPQVDAAHHPWHRLLSFVPSV